MVADMVISSVKQPQHAPSSKGAADPKQYSWLFKEGNHMPSSFAKTDNIMGGMIRSPDNSSNSWETQAFAEDASSLAAGIWPPRAYPCSFCRREFRSAQALGGHMNVHRRDRARLRHSSPPTAPFCLPVTNPQPVSSLFPADRYSINSSAQYPNKSLIKLNTPPISLSMSNILPTATPYTSFAASRPSEYAATSFPLRLQQLASEAASSLMCPQACESSDLIFSLWPTSSTTKSAKFGCHSNTSGRVPRKEMAMEISSSSSFSSISPSSIVRCAGRSASTEETFCRRDAPIIRPEDESPRKKSHITDSEHIHQLSQAIRCSRNGSHDELHAAGIDDGNGVNDDTPYSEQRRVEECDKVVDLELRLGLRRS